MKLLFVSHLYPPSVGGVELHLKHLAEGLVKRGYDVCVLTTNAYSTEAFFLGDRRRIDRPVENVGGVTIRRLPFHTFGRSVFNFFRRVACRIPYPGNGYVRALSFGPRNRRFVPTAIDFDPDVVFGAPLPTLNMTYAWRAAKKMNRPFICIPSYHIFDRCSFHNRYFYKIMRDADVVMVQSPLEGDYLAKEAGVDPGRVIIRPPFPLLEDQLNPPAKDKKILRERYGIGEKYVVLVMGQHGGHKNVGAALEAMPRVWETVEDTALVVAGGTTGYTSTLKARAAELSKKWGGAVHFIDNFRAEEKEDILQTADVFLALSEMESFGIVLVEALNCGLPIVASRNNVARYIVDDWQTGLLVEPRMVEEVAGALVDLLSDDERRARYAARAREIAVRRYDPIRLLDQWEETLARLAGRRNGISE